MFYGIEKVAAYPSATFAHRFAHTQFRFFFSISLRICDHHPSLAMWRHKSTPPLFSVRGLTIKCFGVVRKKKANEMNKTVEYCHIGCPLFIYPLPALSPSPTPPIKYTQFSLIFYHAISEFGIFGFYGFYGFQFCASMAQLVKSARKVERVEKYNLCRPCINDLN